MLLSEHGISPLASKELPDVVKPILEAYITAIERELPGFMVACYLHGSIALGAFIAGDSDIDFVTFVSRQCTASGLEHLSEIHQSIEKTYPACPLEGSYLQWSHLGQIGDAIQPYPHYHDGILNPSEHNEVNAATWWLLKNRGLALVGPDPRTLDFIVDSRVLTAYMRHNLNTYWRRYTREPARMMWLFADYGIQWTVLGVLRQYYTFNENDIISKVGAGEYAVQRLPSRWHRLIQEAIDIRRRRNGSSYRFRIIRAVEALQFLTYVIRLCNTSFAARF
jgi:Domain of unknown function (DUF4111)